MGLIMRVGFLIAHEESPYSGAVRPFINWAKRFHNEDDEVCVFLFNCGEEIIKYFNNMEIPYHNVKSIDMLIRSVKKSGVDIILSDDLYTRIRYLNEIKTILGIKTGVYVQILFGVHSIAEVFDVEYLDLSERLIYKLSRFLPFSLLKNRYVRLLRNQDVVIVNSFTTSTLLQILYGLDNDGVVYPPVDTDIFRPCSFRTKNSVLVYLGSRAGDTNLFLVHKILSVLKKKNIKVFVLGNKKLSSLLTGKFDFIYLHGINDQELAKAYSTVSFTICPQKWETFGYVAAESVACGTPVIAFNVMGLGEIIRETKFGIPVNNERQLLKILLDIDRHTRLFELAPNPKELMYSLDQSYLALLKTLSEHI